MSDQAGVSNLDNPIRIKESTNVTLTPEKENKIPANSLILSSPITFKKPEEENADEENTSEEPIILSGVVNIEAMKVDDDIGVEVKTEETKANEEIIKIKVKYSLNKVKNLDVAKTNAGRPIKLARLVTDDTDLKYELNSGQYLHIIIKEDMIKYQKTQTETTQNGEVTITVEKNSAVEDLEENNPENQIKMSVLNNKTKERTNVVIKLYHTNQSIHLQGGKRMENVTSTSLVADCLEHHWTKNIKDNIYSIKEANVKLKMMHIKAGVVTRARNSSWDPVLKCDFCSFKCNLKHQLTTHRISKHGVQVKPLKISACKRKSSPKKSPELKRSFKGILTNKSKEAFS